MGTDNFKLGVIGVVVVIIVLLFINPIYFVQSGQKAVIKRFGVVHQEVVNEGMRMKIPFVDTVITVNVTPQTVQNQNMTYTKDNQPITVDYNVIYVNPEDDVASTVIEFRGHPYENFAQSKIIDAMKAVAGKYTASEFVIKREQIRREFLTTAQSAVVGEDKKAVIKIIDTPITNVTFDAEYEKAIKEKQVAQQTAHKAEYVLQQARIDAQSKVVTAEGEARALTVKAQAIAKSPQVVQLERIKSGQDIIPVGTKTVIISDISQFMSAVKSAQSASGASE